MKHLDKFTMILTWLLSWEGWSQNWEIVGLPWPYETAELSNITGQHPLLGTLACPSPMRTNPKAPSPSAILLVNLPETSSRENKVVWKFSFKSNLKWWNGDPVEISDIRVYLESALGKAISSQYGGIWTLPPFILRSAGSHSVDVEFQTPPEFGPGILANWPLFRKAQSPSPTSIECVGEYAIESALSDEIVLRSRSKATKIRLTARKPGAVANGFKRVRFQSALDFGGTPWVRMSDEPVKCPAIDLPIFMLLSWNHELWPTNIREFRSILTQLTPRGELLRAGAGHLGELVSGPILRGHPGYNKSVLVRPYTVQNSLSELERLGFGRPSPDQTRRDANGKELSLRIHVSDETSGLVDKVIFDAFHAVGIKIERTSGEVRPEMVHGKLMGVFAVSNEFDWLPLLHSKAAKSILLPGPKDSKLDGILENYAKSISNLAPNHQFLREIHRRIFELEPFSLLLNNRACIETDFTINAQLLENSPTDPEWLLKILGLLK